MNCVCVRERDTVWEWCTIEQDVLWSTDPTHHIHIHAVVERGVCGTDVHCIYTCVRIYMYYMLPYTYILLHVHVYKYTH